MEYKAPLRDIRFALYEVLGYAEHFASLPRGEAATPETVDAVFDEFARLCEEVLEPIYRSGDEEGCTWDAGEVRTPSGFREAYLHYATSGWAGISSDPVYGGQGLPSSMSRVLGEMMGAANTGFTLYTAGQAGAIETLAAHGTPEQRDLYERQLIAGTWNATMCLTEPHCGSDLGLLRTKAEPQADGSYAISGTKIFITGGEHDLTENIVHIVLARLPDAPPGNKGISLFIVPKYLAGADGELSDRNRVFCGSIEHKMGIKASATCVMNFDGATGYLLGQLNRGLNGMFTFMNTSRVATAVQGVTHAELGFQKSLAYARERLQMRSLTGAKNPEGPADPIIVHPDVRRMLMTQKAFAEGNRMLVYYLARHIDVVEDGQDQAARAASQDRLDFLTPVAKAFATETGFESANLGMQCLGGHGYIREWGLEQNVRDARIAMLYEGTTGIQALDLLSRKVLGSGGKMVADFTQEIEHFCRSATGEPELEPYLIELRELVDEWRAISLRIAEDAEKDLEVVGAVSVQYLMYAGYVSLAYLWARAYSAALLGLAQSPQDADFYRAKQSTAAFYFEHILPRTRTCSEIISAGASSLMSLPEEHFRF
ncbi:MAG: acyl-CoA dehydrogenase C-terminal domain-containing protein [Pseudomonadota bacterium]